MQGEPQVDDPGEYNQRLRLQEIAEARKSARGAISDVQELRAASGINAEKFVFGQVQALVTELEWLIRDRAEDDYFEKYLGTVTIPAPNEADFSDGEKVVSMIGSPPESEEVDVRGLFSTESTGLGYSELPETPTHSWTKTVELRHKGPQEVTVTKTAPPPIPISRAANRLCRQFIFEAGLDARIEDEADEDANPI